MKILIGGVPYGRDNVGDEAILASIVKAVRIADSSVEITAVTGEPEATAKKLNIRTVPLLGFEVPAYNTAQLEEEMENADIYIWGGATGLSDYPETALRIADCALKHKAKLVLYSVGMNDELNPAFFKLRDGKKAFALRILTKLTFGMCDFVKKAEEAKINSTRQHIKRTLDQASIIIVRDEQSRKQLQLCNLKKKIHTTADSAIILSFASEDRVQQICQKNNLWKDSKPIIGVCISAQRAIKQISGFAKVMDELIDNHNVNILFIPMNDKTDYPLMNQLASVMKNGSLTRNLAGRYQPEEIAAIAAKTSLIISSRLHLIILASISHVPVIGLARGSKIDNYLSLFNEKTVGSVDMFSPDLLISNSVRLLKGKDEFRKIAEEVIAKQKKKINCNIELLKKLFTECKTNIK